MFRKYVNFVRGISVNRTGKAGVVLATSSFVAFIFFEILRLIGVLTSAFVGLVAYLLLPSLFVLGLLLILFAWKQHKAKTKKTVEQILCEQFKEDETEKGVFGSKAFISILIFSFVSVLFISVAGYRTLSFMEEPKFCGTACHNIMIPEWTTYQVSPHSRVKCVECHVGEGVEALVESKISGLRQMVLASLNAYSKPVPVPVHQLRPSRETCEKCHWPEKFYGSRLKVITRYGFDEFSTPKYNTLSLKIDTGHKTGKAGIHWHIASDNEVRYTSVNDLRRDIIEVEVKQKDGTFKKYVNKKLSESASKSDKENVRVMDCIDCHNRATHIYEDPSFAVDDRMARGLVDRKLPFIKREMVAAITANYPDRKTAFEDIEAHLQSFYMRNYRNVAISMQKSIEQAVETAKEIYGRNIHPYMNVEWGTYPNHIGHKQGKGCFRCHNENLVDENGKHIPFDCTMCHSILASDEDKAFKYLEKPAEKAPNTRMHQYLQDEFLKSTDK